MKNEEFFGQIARSVKGGLRLKKQYNLIAHLEYKDDEPFWHSLISKVYPGLRVQYMPASQNEHGNVTSGKSQCMKFLNYLDQSFIICVDSDSDYLLGDTRMCADKYVFQTYTYSWENHYCKGLAMRDVDSVPFDFNSFLLGLSQILYEPLMIVLYGRKYGVSTLHLEQMNSLILRQQVNQQRMVDDNGTLLLQSIESEMIEVMRGLPTINETDMLSLKEECASKGLSADTAYLYMQGHCIFNLVERIGRFLLHKGDFKGLILDKSLCLSGHEEMEHIQRDLQIIAQ